MRLSLVKSCKLGFLVSLSLVALAATVHAAAPPSGGPGGNGGNGGKAKSRKAQSRPSLAAPATPTAPTRRGPLIDPDGR